MIQVCGTSLVDRDRPTENLRGPARGTGEQVVAEMLFEHRGDQWFAFLGAAGGRGPTLAAATDDLIRRHRVAQRLFQAPIRRTR